MYTYTTDLYDIVGKIFIKAAPTPTYIAFIDQRGHEWRYRPSNDLKLVSAEADLTRIIGAEVREVCGTLNTVVSSIHHIENGVSLKADPSVMYTETFTTRKERGTVIWEFYGN